MASNDQMEHPESYDFETINDFIHGTERHFEELQCAMLGMATHFENMNVALHDAIRRPMGIVPASADQFVSQIGLQEAEARR